MPRPPSAQEGCRRSRQAQLASITWALVNLWAPAVFVSEAPVAAGTREAVARSEDFEAAAGVVCIAAAIDLVSAGTIVYVVHRITTKHNH